MSRHTSQVRSQEGAATVEFAIVVPLLLLVLFGIVDFGRLLFVQVSLAAASHEGARASSLRPATTANQGAVAAAVAAAVAQTAPEAATVGALGSATMSVSSPSYCTAGSDSTIITAQAAFQWVLPVGLLLPYGGDGSLTDPITLSSTSELLCVR